MWPSAERPVSAHVHIMVPTANDWPHPIYSQNHGPSLSRSHTLNLPPQWILDFSRHVVTDFPQGNTLFWPGFVATNFTADWLCSCFLFNDCLRTHMKYFGSANSSGNSKVKPWMRYSWPRLCTAQRDSDDFPNPLHTPSSDPALPVQHYVNKYASHILPLKKKYVQLRPINAYSHCLPHCSSTDHSKLSTGLEWMCLRSC